MKGSTLFQLFTSLNKRDVRELDKILRSPYFNQRADVLRLFNYLCSTEKHSKNKWERENLFSKVYAREEMNLKKLRHLCSFLTNLIRRYFILEEQKDQELEEQMQLCQALRSRNLLQEYEIQWKKLEKRQATAAFQNIESHYHKFRFYFEREDFNNNHRQSRKGYSFLEKTAFELSAHYMAGILRQACMALSQQRFQAKDLALPLLPEVLKEIEKGTYDQSPAVCIYYHAFEALKDLANYDAFLALQKLIQSHWEKFPPAEMRDVYLIAINYCIKRLNQGERQFIQVALDLYKQGLDNEVLLEDGYLSGFDYKNTLRLGLALKEYDWVEKFMEKYTNYLPPKERENIYQYNLAFFYFNKPDYNKAMELLRQVEFNDVFNNLDARRMLLRMYYELGENDALESLLDSFKVYIHRQKNIGYHRTNYLNLIRFVQQMLKRNLNQAEVRKQLRQRIEETAAVAEKEWLLKQLE